MYDTLHALVRDVFGGDEPAPSLTAYQVAARAVVVYLAGLFVVRYGKSRMISRATPLDVILGFILGSLLSRGITGHASISNTVVASTALVAIHYIFTAVGCRWSKFDGLIKGHDVVLVDSGKLHEENMYRSHVSPEDLQEAMRLSGVTSLEEIAEARKERNGEISIIKR
ncbi:MAG: DUF421 domain-containing protein [Aureliella sp.]